MASTPKKQLALSAAIHAAIELGEPQIRRNQIEALCRCVFRAIDSVTGLNPDDPPWLFRCALMGREDARKDPDVQAGILDLIGSPDWIRIAKLLGDSPSSPLENSEINDHIGKLRALLLCHWLAKDGVAFQFSLCYYTDSALAKLCAFQLGRKPDALPSKYVRKTWERLGLKKATVLLFRDVEISKSKVTPVFYKKLRQ